MDNRPNHPLPRQDLHLQACQRPKTGDAGRVSGECGNSAAVIHQHYRELVKPADPQALVWREADASNILPLAAAVPTGTP